MLGINIQVLQMNLPKCLYRVAHKKRNSILPTICGCNDWYQCMHEVTSPEKNDTKISNFLFSIFFSRAHFVRQCQGPNLPFWAKTRAEWMPFRLAIVVSSNPLTLSMCILYTRNPLVKMRIDKVKWIKYCSQLWQAEMALIHALFKLKRENFGPQHCLRKCALENKLLNQNYWSWYHFSQEKLPDTLIPVIASIHVYCGKYAILFLYGPPCIGQVKLWFGQVFWNTMEKTVS